VRGTLVQYMEVQKLKLGHYSCCVVCIANHNARLCIDNDLVFHDVVVPAVVQKMGSKMSVVWGGTRSYIQCCYQKESTECSCRCIRIHYRQLSIIWGNGGEEGHR
jgi:hypothetical protein